jgi:hypothetical protein
MQIGNGVDLNIGLVKRIAPHADFMVKRIMAAHIIAIHQFHKFRALRQPSHQFPCANPGYA